MYLRNGDFLLFIFLLKGRVSIVFNVKAVQHHMTNERASISSAAVV